MKVNHPTKNLARRALSVCLAAVMLCMALPLVLQRPKAFTLTPYTEWKQYDSQWGNNLLYSKTVRESGCLAVATAILAVHSGLKTGGVFDPGQFVSTMRAVGGFTDSNDMVWTAVSKAVPGLVPENPWIAISGDAAAKTSQLEAYLSQGYYIAVSVKSGGHWVALKEVSNGVCVMMDPGSSGTNLFATYPASGVYRIALFRTESSSGFLSNLGDLVGNIGSNISENLSNLFGNNSDIPADSDLPGYSEVNVSSALNPMKWLTGLTSGANFLTQGWGVIRSILNWLLQGMSVFNTLLSPY